MNTFPSVLALVQARVGSTRLPCKSLLCLNGHPLIDWVVKRSAQAKHIDKLIVATPDAPVNAPLVKHLMQQGIPVFQGSETDVLDRFVQAARFAGASEGTKENKGRDGTLIVRICADNPLIWGPELDRLILHFKKSDCDYAYNHIPRNNRYPDGLGAEILTFRLLVEIAAKATTKEHREHCLSYIWDNSGEFSITTFDPEDAMLQRPDVKLDIDTLDDFCKISLMPVTIESTPQEAIAFYPSSSGAFAAMAGQEREQQPSGVFNPGLLNDVSLDESESVILAASPCCGASPCCDDSSCGPDALPTSGCCTPSGLRKK